MRAFSLDPRTLRVAVGVVVLAALDSTLFFSLPFGIDAVVIILAARLRAMWWIVPLLATPGSVAGAALTFWMGVKIGEKGLDRWVTDERRLDAHPPRPREGRGCPRGSRSDSAAVSIHAVRARGRRPRSRAAAFFGTLAVCRIFRFGLEAVLAIRYGSRILSWLDSDIFHDVVTFFIVVALVLTTLSVVKIVRSARSPRQRRAAA